MNLNELFNKGINNNCIAYDSDADGKLTPNLFKILDPNRDYNEEEGAWYSGASDVNPSRFDTLYVSPARRDEVEKFPEEVKSLFNIKYWPGLDNDECAASGGLGYIGLYHMQMQQLGALANPNTKGIVMMTDGEDCIIGEY